MKNIALILLLSIFLILFTGCNAINSIQDIQGLLVTFLSENQASTRVREAYQFSLENPDNVLDNILCYCGCIQSNNHENARACFIENEEVQAIGTYFDKMGLNCGECVETVLTTKSLQAQGKSKEEIRNTIDELYKPNS